MDKEGAGRRVTQMNKGQEMPNRVVSGADTTWGRTNWGKHRGI